ncbi:MAG TPA: OmpH family outer membrane protein [Bacteroidales bacterium]|jgi:outer membrane protein|nr:OmpH family outer membrane protein [Bacteroidales bacterium]
MKNLTLALVAVLFLAVAGLYFIHFSSHKKSGEATVTNEAAPAGSIAFVNIDTVIYKFNMFTDKRNDLAEKQKKAEAELNSKGTQYERGIKDYQDKVQKGLITRATASEMENALTRQQQELIGLRDKLQGDLMEEEQVMNRQILDYITKYLEEHKPEYNYQYILAKSFGSVVLYGDPGNDITSKVLDGLNQKYAGEK